MAKGLRIHSVIPRSSVNGPGERMVVWVQGCRLGCPGCWNADTHADPSSEGLELLGESSVLAELHLGAHGVEGITFSGGEPMHQAEEVFALMCWARGKYPAMSFGMFTGYSQKELDRADYHTYVYAGPARRRRAWEGIKGLLDFAVMGRYNRGQPDTKRPLCSSRNQKLVLFSDRYKLEEFRPKQVEITIAKGGLVTTTGFPMLGPILDRP